MFFWEENITVELESHKTGMKDDTIQNRWSGKEAKMWEVGGSFSLHTDQGYISHALEKRTWKLWEAVFFLSRMIFLFLKPCSSPFNLEHSTVCHKKSGRCKNGKKIKQMPKESIIPPRKTSTRWRFPVENVGQTRRTEKKKDHRPSQRVIGWMLWAVFPMLGVGLKGLPRVVFFDSWFSIVMLTLAGN